MHALRVAAAPCRSRNFARHTSVFAAITSPMMPARRRAARLFQLALLCGLSCGLQPVVAAELSIAWSAPPECPTAGELKDRVMKWMAGSVGANFTAVTEVTTRADKYHAHVVLRDPSGFGERDLEHAQCDALMNSVALLIALSMPGQEGSVRRDMPTDAGLSVPLSVQGRVAFGALPLTAAGLGGAVALEAFSSTRIELHGAYYAQQSQAFAGETLGARFGLWTLGARACRLWSISRLQLGPCLGAELYFASATAFGGVPSLAGKVQWWGPALGMFSRLTIFEPFALYVAAEAVLPLSRPYFRFDDVGDLHRVPALALQVVVAPEVRF